MSDFRGHVGSLGPSFWHIFLSFSYRSPREAIWELFRTHLGGISGACKRYLGVFGVILEVFGCYKLKLKAKAKAKAKAKS